MRDKIAEVLKKVIGEPVEVFIPEKENFGHYSTNFALRLAKKKKENPLKFAEKIADEVKKQTPGGFFDKIEIAPPGFINFWISRGALQEEFAAVSRGIEKFGRSKIGDGKTIIVEYSQPNIAKKMHVGHLRTTIIGDALANIFDFLGYKVIRWNYIGDWGTQFGKLISAYKLWGDRGKVESNPVKELQKLYVRFHDELKTNPGLEKMGQEEFRKLEEGDEENMALWEWFKKESLKEFERIYTILGVKFDVWIGESFFEPEMKPLVARLLRGGVAEQSEGAVVIPLDKFGLPPALIQKADGASLYLTRDIANLEYRIKKYKPAKILYVVGNEQSLHFEQLFAVAKILGLEGTELRHVKYGLVLGESGEKLATREGRTILLDDVVEKVIRLALEIIEKKNPSLSEAEKEKVAEAVGVGALKYNDLKENRTTDIVFDWKKMLDLSGDSAPYLQYTYARLQSILRKASQESRVRSQESGAKSQESGVGGQGSSLNGEIELALMRKIFEFPDEVVKSARDLQTSNLANYLYKLAVLANRFYETTPVLKEENDGRRGALLALVSVAASILGKGLGLLGIRTPEEI
jgi:arginyl-tRNA synthetase